MRFTVSQSSLARAISVVAKGIATQSTLPVLTGVLVTAREGTIELQTTNLNISIRHATPANVEEEGATVVFIEVKRRTTARFGRPAEAVTPVKRARIVRTALLYLQQKRLMDAPVRFDVVELTPGEIRHIRGAFDASDIL